MEALEKTKVGKRVRFFGSFTNKIDAKGRLSVPAEFRKSLEALAEQYDGAVICLPSFTGPFLECGGADLVEIMFDAVSHLDFFDEDRDVLEFAITSRAMTLSFDDNGRIVVPKGLREHANLAGMATFAGASDRFQIWEPEAHQAKQARADKLIAASQDLFRGRSLPSVTSKGRRADG